MGKQLSTRIAEILVAACIVLVFLGCLGWGQAFGSLCFNLAFGWMIYLYRVLPQVRFHLSGIVTAIVCVGALAIGLQWFLRWFASQRHEIAAGNDTTPSTWPARRTGALLSLILLMFIAGICAVGISHQTGWLLTSPEPIVEGGIRHIAASVQSQNNLHQMAVAMLGYREIEKTLPPAAIYDRHGKPLLSWRVRILPYIEEQNLYKEFHLDEPWDSPHNLRLLPRMPRIYALPDRGKNVKPHSTPYQVFVGKGAAFEGKRGLRIPNDFPDGTSDTILIVEAAESVPWTKPADLRFDQRPLMPALHRWSTSKTCLIALADGSVRTIPQSMKESTLRAAITRNGGEALGPDW